MRRVRCSFPEQVKKEGKAKLERIRARLHGSHGLGGTSGTAGQLVAQ